MSPLCLFAYREKQDSEAVPLFRIRKDHVTRAVESVRKNYSVLWRFASGRIQGHLKILFCSSERISKTQRKATNCAVGGLDEGLSWPDQLQSNKRLLFSQYNCCTRDLLRVQAQGWTVSSSQLPGTFPIELPEREFIVCKKHPAIKTVTLNGFFLLFLERLKVFLISHATGRSSCFGCVVVRSFAKNAACPNWIQHDRTKRHPVVSILSLQHDWQHRVDIYIPLASSESHWKHNNWVVMGAMFSQL